MDRTIGVCVLALAFTPLFGAEGDATTVLGRTGFPPAGPDEFPVSLAQIGIDLTLNVIPDAEISAEGPFLVERSDPQAGSDGRNVIDTEIVQLDLTGSSSLGPVTIRSSPTRRSVGQIVAQQRGQDFPADSFFDIFVEIRVGELTLVNEVPIRMSAVITEIPPKTTVYRSLENPIVPLTDGRGEVVALLLHVAHAPNSTDEIRNEDLKILVERVQLQLELVNKKLELLTRNIPVGLRTQLLFPFNVSAGNLATGLAIDNTPRHFAGQGIGSRVEGGCQFELYPTNQPGSPISVTTSQLSRAGLGSGSNAEGEIPPGGTYSVLVSELLRAAGVEGSFVGHLFALCEFPSAQGINFIADSQFSTQSQGYPAIVIK